MAWLTSILINSKTYDFNIAFARGVSYEKPTDAGGNLIPTAIEIVVTAGSMT